MAKLQHVVIAILSFPSGSRPSLTRSLLFIRENGHVLDASSGVERMHDPRDPAPPAVISLLLLGLAAATGRRNGRRRV
jgi:MYXO-CTERM domain-containing protein